MKLNYSKILDIKCVLANVTKKQLANDLGISQMTLSREIKDKSIIQSLDDYFNLIDPEINLVCNKLRNDDVLVIEEPLGIYQKKGISSEKYIELQERLLKSQEERLKYLENERKRIIEKYGDVYSK